MIKRKIPVLVYNGNTDMAVPYTGTKAWMQTMNWTASKPFSAWNYHDPAYPWGPQAAGWSTQYENNLWFVLVNGAGHMVPQTRRAAAFDMFERFTSGKGF
jgi:serine carboxypeptidase-like clade 1